MSDNQPQVGTVDPFSKGYKHRYGEPVSDACGDGKHSKCTQDLTKCHCTYRGGHTVMHAYANAPVPQPTPAEPRIESVPDERAELSRDDYHESQIQQEFMQARTNNGAIWQFWLHRQLVLARKRLAILQFDGRARAGSSLASEDLRGGYVSFPLEFREPKTDNDGPYIYDANGKQVAMLFWPTHPIEETEAAEQATYRLGRAMAEAGRSRSDSYIKVPPLRFGACQVCWTCSWAPCEEGTPESFKVGDDEWVICQLCDANRRLRLASPPSSPGAAQTERVHIGKVITCSAQSVVEAACICKPGWGHRSFHVDELSSPGAPQVQK